MKEEPGEIASLIGSLNHANKRVIRQAADSLIAMAPRLPQLAQRLDQLLSETPQQSRWPIAYVLARLSKLSPLCLGVLIDTLDDRDPDIRWAAARLLVDLGKINRDIDVLVLRVVKIGTAVQRRMALYCLRDLQLSDAASLQALLDALQDTDPLVRLAAVTSVKSRPDAVKEGAAVLLRLFLEDPDAGVRHNAAIALAQAPPTDEIRAALEKASVSENAQLKKAANAALALMKKKGPSEPQAVDGPSVD